MELFKVSFLFFALLILLSCNKKSADVTISEAVPLEITKTEREGRQSRKGKRNPEAQKRRQKEFYAQLNLSEAQIVKVEEILAKYQVKRRELWEKNNGDRGIVRSEMQKQQREQNAELSSVMTKEQFAKYLEIKREQRRTRGGRGGGPPGGRNGK